MRPSLQLGNPSRDSFERLAAVDRFVDSRPCSESFDRIVVVETVSFAFVSCNQHLVGFFEDSVERRSRPFVIDVENFLPGLTAIDCLEQSSFRVLVPHKSAQRTDPNDVRILRMNGECPGLKRLLQPHVLPGLAAVSRFVNAVAPGNAVAGIGFSSPDPDDVRIALRDLHVTDRNRGLIVELVFEVNSVIGGLQQTARCRCRPPDARVFFINGNRGNATAHVGRPDRTPLDAVGD